MRESEQSTKSPAQRRAVTRTALLLAAIAIGIYAWAFLSRI
jgi:hypothetical protein